MAHQISVKSFFWKTHKLDGEERDPTKGTHKNKYEQAGCFQLKLRQTGFIRHTSYVPFIDIYNALLDCKVCLNVYFPFVSCHLIPLTKMAQSLAFHRRSGNEDVWSYCSIWLTRQRYAGIWSHGMALSSTKPKYLNSLVEPNQCKLVPNMKTHYFIWLNV